LYWKNIVLQDSYTDIEEAIPTEEVQAEPMDVENDAPHLDLEGDQELQVYNIIKSHEFVHTAACDLEFSPR
jgi:hypothetical protein